MCFYDRDALYRYMLNAIVQILLSVLGLSDLYMYSIEEKFKDGVIEPSAQ